jgi:hypothetical protein
MKKETTPALQAANKSETEKFGLLDNPDMTQWSVTLLNARSNEVTIATEWWEGDRVVRIYTKTGGWMTCTPGDGGMDMPGTVYHGRAHIEHHKEEVIQFEVREEMENFIKTLQAAMENNWPEGEE